VPSRPPRTLTIARVAAVEITVHWRWALVLALGVVVLAGQVVPVRYPSWDPLTAWAGSLALVLALELTLLLHELSHALVARRRGQPVLRIVFHGLRAETQVNPALLQPRDELHIALAGPGVNLVLAGLLSGARALLAPSGALDAIALTLVLANVAMAAANLLPFGSCDGGRALRAVRLLADARSAKTPDCP
jgi:Zn-dependent protease